VLLLNILMIRATCIKYLIYWVYKNTMVMLFSVDISATIRRLH